MKNVDVKKIGRETAQETPLFNFMRERYGEDFYHQVAKPEMQGLIESLDREFENHWNGELPTRQELPALYERFPILNDPILRAYDVVNEAHYEDEWERELAQMEQEIVEKEPLDIGSTRAKLQEWAGGMFDKALYKLFTKL